MRILIEEYQYDVASVKDVLHGIDALESIEGKVDFEKARKAYEDIWNAEGSQYQIYDDIGIAWMAPSKSSIKNLLTPDSSVDGGKPCGWWLRTSCPDDAGKFRRVGEDGALGKANAGQNAGVAPGFCL